MSVLPLLIAALLPGQADLEKTAERIIRQTNEYREQKELKPVEKSRKLQKAAQYFADYLAEHEKLDHEADDSTPAKRAEEYGYEYCLILENIASEFREEDLDSRELARSLVKGWQESEHHRENMLDPDATETGVAVARNAKSGRYYAVQMFGRPKSAAIEFTLANESKDEVTYELDGKELTISGRTSRAYSVCLPTKIVVHLGDDRRETLTPKEGQIVAIVQKDGRLKVERRKEE